MYICIYIYIYIYCQLIYDQFSFKPSCSTETALVDMINTIPNVL